MKHMMLLDVKETVEVKGALVLQCVTCVEEKKKRGWFNFN